MSKKCKLKVPETVTIINQLTDEPVMLVDEEGNQKPYTISFYTFVVANILKDPKFGENAVTVIQAVDVRNALKDAEPSATVEIDGEAAELMKEVVKKPNQPYNPETAMSLTSYFKAILDME